MNSKRGRLFYLLVQNSLRKDRAYGGSLQQSYENGLQLQRPHYNGLLHLLFSLVILLHFLLFF